jgi:hypothetical protein
MVFVAASGSADAAAGTGLVGAAAAGDTAAGGTIAGGTVATGGTVAGGTVAGLTVLVDSAAGGTVAGADDAGGTVVVAGEPAPAAAGVAVRGATGPGFHSDGVGPAGRSGSWESALPKDDGGQAGIVCSVGGSGGQMSLCVGISASGWTFGGQVRGPDLAGGAVGLGSGSPALSAGAGTVWAHEGAGFCIGTAGFGWVSSSATGVSSAGGSV